MQPNLYNPDVLTCLANLSNDEVFTPPQLANQMLDMLPQELFENKETTFLDPCCKSGVFLREIAKRLIKGLEREIPDLQERLNHIYTKQLFGIAITELTALLSRRSTYCSKFANGEYSVCTDFDSTDGNIWFKRIQHTWENGRCKYCGASQSEYDREKSLETHAYQFIHNPKELKKMKFDVIVGNPPYQMSDGGGMGSSATPLYHYFVQQAKKLNPRHLTMIIPARWYSGGKGLDEFRDEMLHDNRLRVIHDFFDASECFPSVEIKGGVCYFLWDRDNAGNCNVYTHKNNKIISSSCRPLLEDGCSTFIRYNEAISILKKVQSHKEETMDKQVSPRKPFGIEANYENYDKTPEINSVRYYARGVVAYINPAFIKQNKDWIKKYKVLLPKAFGAGSGGSSPDIMKPFVVEPNSCCSETYLIMGLYDNKEQANNLLSYLKTNFCHFLLSLIKNTQNASRAVFSFIPIQDFNEPWTDEKLYKKYGLTQEEIDFIESMIRPME